MRYFRLLLLTFLSLFLTASSLMDNQGAVSFPVSYDGMITVEKQAVYEGLFYENGLDEPVVNIAALIVKNESDNMIEYLHIICHSSTADYDFSCTMLPAGCRILIPEQSTQRWQDEKIEKIDYTTSIWNGTYASVSASEVTLDSIQLTNDTEEDFESIRVYYRSYFEPDQLLIGGTSFFLDVMDLHAGEKRIVYLPHFASGYSIVTAIENTDT